MKIKQKKEEVPVWSVKRGGHTRGCRGTLVRTPSCASSARSLPGTPTSTEVKVCSSSLAQAHETVGAQEGHGPQRSPHAAARAGQSLPAREEESTGDPVCPGIEGITPVSHHRHTCSRSPEAQTGGRCTAAFRAPGSPAW